MAKVKGTQDFVDLKLYNYIVDAANKYLEANNYKQIMTPIIEHLDLFKRSLGITTDVVNKEMFIIQQEGEEKNPICLRPEATAATMRAFLENGIQNIPWKVFSVGPMFRYERPQKGRFRQFHQLNIEFVGSDNVYQDAEFIKMLDKLFSSKLKLDNYALHINYLGSFEDRKNFSTVLKKFLDSVADKICKTCSDRKDTNTLRVLDCKNPDCQTIYNSAPKTAEHLSSESKKEWQTLQDVLEMLSVSFVINSKLVRGLDYYNKTIFEFVSSDLGAQSAFCGGGRYDGLVKEISDGKQDVPSMGAAIGIERLMILLENRELDVQEDPLHVIMPLSEEQFVLAMLVEQELLKANFAVETILERSSLKSMMRKANKMGAKYSLIIGEDEQKNRTVLVKNMVNGQENVINQPKLVGFLT